MELNELQLCLTNVCSVDCEYCHLDKKEGCFVSLEVVDKVVELAKKNKIGYIRLTGGDVFEHQELEAILRKINASNLKIILNVSFDKLQDTIKIQNLFDTLLLSFQNIEQLEKFDSSQINNEFMGCVVFQPSWLKNLKHLTERVNLHDFSSFFFLRDVNNSSKDYFTALNECVERVLQLSKKITFANSFPLCFVGKKNIDFCSGKRFDNGNERFYITENGDLKPSAYSSIILGNVLEEVCLEEIYNKNQELIVKVQNKTRFCKNCAVRDYCGSGILTKKSYEKDPLLKHVFFNKYLSKLQCKIKETLPLSDFKEDLKKIYFMNSGFFMRYPPSEYWKPSTKEELDSLLNVKDKDISIYLHFPFCDGFCDFCKIQKFDNSERDFYSEFLLGELDNFKDIISNNKIKSVYFGGGSPQLMGLDNAKKVFSKLFELIGNPVEEVNFEFFPKNFDKDFMDFLNGYVTRVSLGIQCFNDEVLKGVGRNVSKGDMVDFITKTKGVGFKTVNFDVIYGLYSSIPEMFESDFKEILSFNPDQVTFQPLHYIESVGLGDFVDNELDLNHCGRNLLKDAGYAQFSSEDFSKRDRLVYQDALLGRKNILGIGRGAFGILNNVCFKNDNDQDFFHKLSKVDRLYAKLFLSSRLFDFKISVLNKEFGVSFKAFFSDSLRYLLKNDFINIVEDDLIITDKGKEYVDLVCNVLSLSNLDYKK